jgi:hypothetical protein
VHQVYELWFKQTLHELDSVCCALLPTFSPSPLCYHVVIVGRFGPGDGWRCGMIMQTSSA